MVFNHVIDYDKLSKIGFKIQKEMFPDKILTDIKFRHPMGGNKTKSGVITKKRFDNIYRINITTTRCDWVEDEINGTHIHRKTKKKIRRHDIGILNEPFEIVETLAHELAHLVHWNHDILHKKLTKEIFNKLMQKEKEFMLKLKIKCEV